jgi:hypothetical protein
MKRDQVLTVRLSRAELQLLAVVRLCCPVVPSQADVISWALEDLCNRIANGDNANIDLLPDAQARCAQAVEQLRAHRHGTFRGRPPRETERDRIVATGQRLWT